MNLTKLTTVLVVVLAMSAVVASSASAKMLISNAGVNTASLKGEDTAKTHVLTIDGQSLTCENTVMTTGTINLPAATLTMNTVANGCSSFGFAGATVNMGNCHYRINTPTKLKEHEYTASLDIICNGTANSANNVINISSSVFGSECSVSIGAQAGRNHIIIHNTTTNVPKDITLTTTLEGITATKNKDNGLCPLSGTGTVNNVTTNGSLTVKDTNNKDIFLEN